MKDKFLRGAMILTAAGLMVKVLGSVNRILLSRLLGGEGIGLYQIAYPIYLFLISVSGAGVPIAISILIARKLAARDTQGAKRIFQVSLIFITLTGLIFALGLYFLANFFITSGIIRDARAYYALLALIPAVFLSTILGGARGYFQGEQKMTPPAISQILEQFTRVVVMLGLAYYLLPKGLEYAAAGAAFGAVPGAITGLCVLSYCYYREQKKLVPLTPQVVTPPESVLSIGKALLLLALPVSCANLMLPLVTGIDMLMVPARLEVAGFSIKEATTAFGYLAGMAMPLVSMSTIPTTSLAASVVPALSEAKILGDALTIERKTSLALRLTLLFTVPAAVGLMLLGPLLSSLLYGTLKAGAVISALAPSIVFLGLHQVTTGILQGLGYTLVPMLTMLFSALVKVGALWVLVANPLYHIEGAAWASNLNFALAAALNLGCLVFAAKVKIPWKSVARISLAAVSMGGLVFLTLTKSSEILGAKSATFLALFIGVISYMALLLLWREFTPKQVREIWKKQKK